MKKILVLYTIKAAFNALEPSAGREAMRVVEELQQYGGAWVIDAELVEGDIETWEPAEVRLEKRGSDQ